MIPDFKTYIGESVWADIHRRSNGTQERKEDDVNFMDFDTLAEHIKDTYSEKGVWFSVVEGPTNSSRHIEIEIISGITLSFNEVDGKIYNILIQSGNKYVDVPGLKKIFNVNILGSSTFSVVEKDWTKSNNTFVKLIEFFLKKKTNESVWADMHRRSNGEQERKEDAIDNYSREQFIDYLRSRYKPVPSMVENYNFVVDFRQSYHNVTAFHYMKSDWNHLTYPVLFYGIDDGDLEICVMGRVAKDLPEVYDALADRYILTSGSKADKDDINISPKDGGKPSLSFGVEVIDFLMSIVKEPYKKIIELVK